VARTRWECVGQALLGLRGETAWISGVGVVPAWRRRGVAGLMMRELLNEAARGGARHVLLEVIDRNTAARNLYKHLGMSVSRELLTWQRPAGADPLPIPQERLLNAPALELLEHFAGWHDQPASWQRAEPTLRHMAGRLIGYRLEMGGKPAAYCLVAPGDESISLIDVGINPAVGLLMPGRLLLQALAARYLGHAFSIMNVPVDDELNRILASLGYLVTLRQIEMEMELGS
jgi:hypothetical protein